MGAGRGINSYEQFIVHVILKIMSEKVCNSRWGKAVTPELLKKYNMLIGTLYRFLKNKFRLKMHEKNKDLANAVGSTEASGSSKTDFGKGEKRSNEEGDELLEEEYFYHHDVIDDYDDTVIASTATTTTFHDEGEQKIKQDVNQYIRHPKPGGYLYLYSVDCSGWKIKEGEHKGKQLYQIGKADEGRIGERLIEHQQQHPQHKLEIHWVWKVLTNVLEEETTCIRRAQDHNIHWSSPYTRKSEGIFNKEKFNDIFTKKINRGEWKKVPNPEKFLDRDCEYEKILGKTNLIILSTVTIKKYRTAFLFCF